MELSYYWTLGPRIDIGWVPDTFILIHLFIYSIATYRAFIMGSLLSIQPPDPGGLPLISPQNPLSLAGPPSVSGCLSCTPTSAHISPHSLCLRGEGAARQKEVVLVCVCMCVSHPKTKGEKENRDLNNHSSPLIS